jgi:hypothetical protein
LQRGDVDRLIQRTETSTTQANKTKAEAPMPVPIKNCWTPRDEEVWPPIEMPSDWLLGRAGMVCE